MRIAVFATKPYDRRSLDAANAAFGHELSYFDARLDAQTAPLAAGFAGVCVFVNDRLDAPVLERLAEGGTTLVALRCAGFNNVDLKAAARLGLTVVRVPAYSPHAVAEFTIGLMLAVDRHIPRAWARVRDNNFALEGLIGRNLHGRTVGVVGTGKIGALVALTLVRGFGCRVLAYDVVVDPALVAEGVTYADVRTVMAEADILTLHCPLTPQTRHLVDAAAIERARPGLLIVNTSRGALVDTRALIDGLKSHKLDGVALDVYEQEADLFFEDLSNEIVQDDVFQRLLTFPNVVVTGHQAFFTEEALAEIARTTLSSAAAAEAGAPLVNRVDAPPAGAPQPAAAQPAAVPAAPPAAAARAAAEATSAPAGERGQFLSAAGTGGAGAFAAPPVALPASMLHAEAAGPASAAASAAAARAVVQPLCAVRGWHAHVYYDPAATRDAAERLRERIAERFEVQLGRWHDVPVGPHAAAMYQVAFTVDAFAALVPWLALNRGGLSVLVHPDTLAPRDDHLRHALWLGTPLPVKGEVLPESSHPGDEPALVPNTAPTVDA